MASRGLPQLPLLPWSPNSQSGGWIIRDSSTSFQPADVMRLEYKSFMVTNVHITFDSAAALVLVLEISNVSFGVSDTI